MLCKDFDPDRRAMINPEDHIPPVPGCPEIYVGVFSDYIVDAILAKYEHELLFESRTVCGNLPIYKMNVDGTEIAFSKVWVGGPAAVALIEEVWPLGVKYFSFAGSVGVLNKEIARNRLIVPTSAVRDEGTSFHYLPPSEEVELETECVAACREALSSLGLPFAEGKVWTTDGFYRETRGKVAKRQEQGCICVDMECASLAAAAKFRGVKFAQFFWGGDNLDAPEWEERGLSDRGATIGDVVFAGALETGKRLKSL